MWHWMKLLLWDWGILYKSHVLNIWTWKCSMEFGWILHTSCSICILLKCKPALKHNWLSFPLLTSSLENTLYRGAGGAECLSAGCTDSPPTPGDSPSHLQIKANRMLPAADQSTFSVPHCHMSASYLSLGSCITKVRRWHALFLRFYTRLKNIAHLFIQTRQVSCCSAYSNYF